MNNQGSPRKKADPGRPRKYSDSEILEVVLSLLDEFSYQQLSLRRIADAADLSIPALYRRWPNKDAIVADAIVHYKASSSTLSGDYVADLRMQLEDVSTIYTEILGLGPVANFLSEENSRPELIEIWRRMVIHPRRDTIASIVEEAKRSGEVLEDVDGMVVGDLLVGSIYARLISGRDITDSWLDQVMGIVGQGSKREGGIND